MNRSRLLPIGVVLSVGLAWMAQARANGVAIPATTRQVVLEKNGDVYRWAMVEKPIAPLGDGQVLIHLHAVSLNHGDSDRLQVDPKHDRSGNLVTNDAAGEIVALGKNVHGFKIGERVTNTYFVDWTDGPPTEAHLSKGYGYTADGLLSEYLTLPQSSVVAMPPGLTYEEGATLPTAALTAWTALTAHGRPHRGAVVLVQGTGGVSGFTVQFASAMGARVIVTSSSDDKLARMRAFGMTDGINYHTTPNWSQKVLDLTGGRGADFVVDLGGKATLAQSVDCLAYGGKLEVVGGLTGYDGLIPAEGILLKDAEADGVFVGSRADYTRMAAFIVQQHLHPIIDHAYPLAQYEQALEQMRSNNFVGKIVLSL